jgi:hypothetical protein
MKNIHLIPTDKPSSKLQKTKHGNFFLSNEIKSYSDCTNQHIYITSDEEIKEGDWFLLDMSHSSHPNEVHQMGHNKWSKTGGINFSEPNSWTKACKKIILTTDQDLIADGVQSIDDEFLEWFVKNPSCESVVVNDSKVVKEHIFDGSNDGEIVWEKKIIIPKEEPKQETLEEASSRLLYSKYPFHPPQDSGYWKDMFIEGAKWQQERSYSEAIEFAEWIRIKDFQTTSKNNWIGLDMKYYTTQKLFKQFKKK